jgi:tRNA(Ile)-lysidine synthase
LYHISVHELAERVLSHIRREELLRAGDRVGAAVSGGIDSVALLRLLLELRHELGIVLSVVHFNHKLRGAESDADQKFVEALAREHDLEFYCESGDAAELASHKHSGLEAAARELRYGFFRRLLGAEEPDVESPQGLKPEHQSELIGPAKAGPFPIPTQAAAETNPFQNQNQEDVLDKIATGHTLDDQAETVLMRLIRGTGLRGLGGIHPRIVMENEYVDAEDDGGHGEIVRPLLGVRHRELQQYLTDLKQPWREDSSNADFKFTRNRVRSLVMPLLEQKFNPSVVENFAELAEIARDEEDYWDNEVSGWLGTVVQWSQPEWMRGRSGFDSSQEFVQIGFTSTAGDASSANEELLARVEESDQAVMNASLSRPWLLTEPRAVQRRVLKAIGEQVGIPLEFKHIEEILRFAAEDGPSGKELSLPLGWKIVREPEAMVFVTPDLRRQERIPDYEYPLPVPGRVVVAELGVVIEALLVTDKNTPEPRVAEYNPQELLQAELLPGPLTVRNWRPGDRYWAGHTKAPKKIKELLQERHVTQPQRRLWPVVVSGDEIVWMRGFPLPARLRAKREKEAILIRETPREFEDRSI